jgi:hypothetical protein
LRSAPTTAPYQTERGTIHPGSPHTGETASPTTTDNNGVVSSGLQIGRETNQATGPTTTTTVDVSAVTTATATATTA